MLRIASYSQRTKENHKAGTVVFVVHLFLTLAILHKLHIVRARAIEEMIVCILLLFRAYAAYTNKPFILVDPHVAGGCFQAEIGSGWTLLIRLFETMF